MNKLAISAVFLLICGSTFAYRKEGSPSGGNGIAPNNGQSKSAGCSPAASSIKMEFNDVSAFIEQGGSMFQDRNNSVAAYRVPKGGKLHVIYAGALWMGGTDVNGQLKLAGLTFRTTGNDFWPGPLTVSPGTGNYNPNNPVGDDAVRDYGEANIDGAQCEAYDRFFSVTKAMVIKYTIFFECGLPGAECSEVPVMDSEELLAINSWPAHGDVSLGQDYYLAPFYDRDKDGNYDPSQGDTPWYDDILGRDDIECGVDRRISLFGDVTHWWVFNDKGNIHTESQGEPIGMEIRAQAFAFGTNDEVNRMTFYNYEMINRSTQTLFETYFSQYIDGDIGNSADDYAGCDVSRGLGFTYNGDTYDEAGTSSTGYGDNPPAVGVDFFEGPYQDADGIDNVGPYYDSDLDSLIVPTVADAINGKGIVYKGIGVGYGDSIEDNERFGMRRFTYYTNGGPISQSDPDLATHFYNYMSGFWRDGSETFYGGTGYGGSPVATSILSDYMFPADSDPLFWATAGQNPGFAWDEQQAGNAFGDRRFVQSAGPFTLKPGAVNNITVGIVYGRGNDGSLLASVNAMKRGDTKAQALFDACFRILDPPNSPRLKIQELENQLVLTIDNPATSNNVNESYHEEDEINITDPTVDRYYTFEGYQIYQMIDDKASIGDIGSEEKARLVVQCDIKNGVARLVNFEFDEELGFSVPKLKVEGENKGIKHSFLIEEDRFALGDRRLVNNKTYYYIAIAYAHNEYKKYDPNDPTALDGQKIPYISSRLSYDGTEIKAVAGVPHNPAPEAGGTIQKIEYGSGPIITREDGHGNGGGVLELTAASRDEIAATGKMDRPSYTYGKGPINVKVIDPLGIKGGYYECRFRDYSPSSINGADTASWVIYRYETGSSNVIVDSVTSERTIMVDNEQLIPKWGVSVQIEQPEYPFPEGASGQAHLRTTEFLEASLTFGDSSKRWLSGVPDGDQFNPLNWIRSGNYSPGTDECVPGDNDYDPCSYPDQANADNEKKFDRILGGTIAPNRLVGFESDHMPMAYAGNVSSSKQIASISCLPSVDIIITSDKSKWTRCPVIELGRDPALNVGGAKPGELRETPSVDKNGNPVGPGVGMGWFPGYAIDLESGRRLYMIFGENSFLAGDNGADLIWNPTERLFNDVGEPIMGGMQPFYVMNFNSKTINGYALSADFPEYIPSVAENDASNQALLKLNAAITGGSQEKRELYSNFGWTGYPLAADGYSIDPKNLPTDVTIKLRVSKQYKNFSATGKNGGRPMYSWNMDDIETTTGSADQLADALDIINVVPNPYYAYSQYERSRIDTRVKITNLPEICTVRIFSVNGKLIRTFKKDSPITSLDWDLNNHKGIPVAGGVYLIHVDVPGVGEKIVKFFGGMRQVDLHGI